MKLTVSTWNGPLARHDDPRAAKVHAAIARLDGAGCTEVSLARNDPFACVIAAGRPRLYLVTGKSPDGEILQLIDPDAGQEDAALETVSLVCGGQRADFARRDLVEREAATAILLRFRQHRGHIPSPAWEVQ